MRFEKWVRLTILCEFDPDNENQVDMGSRFLQRMSFQATSQQERLCCIFVQTDRETLTVDLMLQ